jgi:RNA polymerase I specific initiation factor
MTTILHRSLLEEDFVRASRALGMLLRDEVGGKPIDIRAEGRWGIGAEILIRQDAQRQHRSREQSRSSSKEQNSSSEEPRAWFTRKGLEDAKKYYERLIVQYPFYKQNPGAVSALDFYPAMFGLWIHVVHQEAKIQCPESDFVGNGLDADGELMSGEASPVMQNPSRHEPTLEELSQASEIADRMDSVMSVLPYREDVNLVELRKMVRLWIRDLAEALESSPEEYGMINPREDTPMEFLTSGVTKVSLHSER